MPRGHQYDPIYSHQYLRALFGPIFLAHMPEGKVFAAFADGSVAVLQVMAIELSTL